MAILNDSQIELTPSAIRDYGFVTRVTLDGLQYEVMSMAFYNPKEMLIILTDHAEWFYLNLLSRPSGPVRPHREELHAWFWASLAPRQQMVASRGYRVVAGPNLPKEVLCLSPAFEEAFINGK